jgi:uncharacterized protein (TIGR03067 family)
LGVHFTCQTTAAKAGTRVSVTTSDGSRADAEAWLEILASDAAASQPTLRAPSLPAGSPAADRQALQGQWKVVRVEQGKNLALPLQGPQRYIDFNKIDRLSLQEGQLETFSLKSGPNSTKFYGYQIHGATPMAIDFIADDRENNWPLAALGIYEISGDRLNLRMRWVLPGVKNPSRPKSLADKPAANDVFLVLERYLPPADEIAVRGCWDIVREIEDGKIVSQEPGFHRICWFYENSAIDINDVEPITNVISGRYVMEGDTSPAKTITVSQYQGKELLGVYKFEGAQLSIAYRAGGPQPETFESKPGSGVTLLVLERPKPAANPKPDEPKSGKSERPMGAMKNPPATILKPEK